MQLCDFLNKLLALSLILPNDCIFLAELTLGALRSDNFQALRLENPTSKPPVERLDLTDVRNSLKSLNWRAVGVRRTCESLTEASQTIHQWFRYALTRQLTDPTGWELQNMLTVSMLMIESALKREESRGVHLRTDFPETNDPVWKRRLEIARDP